MTFYVSIVKKRILLSLALFAATTVVYAQNTTEQCYRGNFEIGYFYNGGESDTYRYAANMISINTSHGFQFNPYLYLGAGMGFHFYKKHENKYAKRAESVEIPLFFNVRGIIGTGKICVFADAKAGAYLTESMYPYLGLLMGLRFATDEKKAITFSFGYESSSLDFLDRRYNYVHFVEVESNTTKKASVQGISFKVGFEF